MADRYDVAARLAEGGPAVEHTQTYVRACQALGYQQPDLTANPLQVSDWFDSEAGLDLRMLDGDTIELQAAVTAIEEALWVQRTQVTELAAAWRGSGAESARSFLQHHCDAAAEVASHVRAAAEHCALLRDEMWQTVDGRVAAAVAIDERRVAERATWLTAAHDVAAGSSDRSAAEAIVRQQILPYVDNDIRHDWLAAMSSANASVAASYDTAIHALAPTREVAFDVPGDLGPRWQPAFADHQVVDVSPVVSPAAGPMPTVPAAASAPERIPDSTLDAAPDGPANPGSDSTAPADDPAGLSTGAGGLGGVGGLTGGIGGVVGSIVDGLGSLLGSLVGGLGGGSGFGEEPTDLDDVLHSGQPDEEPERDAPEDPDKPEDLDTPDESVEPDSVSAPAGVADGPPEPPAVDSPPVAAEVSEPVAQHPEAAPPDFAPNQQTTAPTDLPTPCEIAEDQLPQAGQ